MKLCIILVATLVVFLEEDVKAESLNEWLIKQIVAEEQLLSKALTQTDGHSFDLLRDSKYYVPFFLEAPKGFSFESPQQQSSFEEFASKQASRLLSGGYIYRITFNHAPRLYATSAGYWEGSIWRSLELERDFTIESDQVWEGTNGDYLYATLLAGVRPRIFVYDQRGEMKKQEAFDASAVDFEPRLEAALKPYSQTGKPVLEMVSLAEYLKNQDAAWRAVDTSGQFNLRNQQQRPDEQERLKLVGQLTRSVAVGALLLTSAEDNASAPNPQQIVQPPAPKKASDAKAVTTTNESASTPRLVWAVLIVAGIGLLWLLLKNRK